MSRIMAKKRQPATKIALFRAQKYRFENVSARFEG
jgi:hypothetical protein